MILETVSNIYRGLTLIRMLNFDPNARIPPIIIEIAATSACNYKCCFCHSHSYLKANCVEPTFMSDELIHNLFINFKELRVKELLFSGDGEPLLSKALINEIKNWGKHFKIGVLSNGSTLDRVDEELFDNLNMLTISINSGNGLSHQLTHGYKGENKFQEIVKHIERILNFLNANNKIRLSYVITTDNYDEIESFFKMAIRWEVSFIARPVSVDFEELRIKELNQQMLDELNKRDAQYLANRTLSSKLLLSFQRLSRACRRAWKELEGIKNLYPCYPGFIQPYIGSNGDVLLCCDGQEKPLGNLNKDSFVSIWQKTTLPFRIMATQMHKTNKPIFDTCYNCANAQGYSLVFHNIYQKFPVLSKLLESRNRKLNPLE